MTGCGCTDPVVFGHQSPCERELGPRWAGEAVTNPTRAAGQYQAEYPASEIENPFSGPPAWHLVMARTALKWADAMRRRFTGT